MENIINLPDFRIYEKIMRLLYKFSGKIDQFSKAYEYYIQSYGIDNPLFSFIDKEIETFYDFDIKRRKIYSYPPFVNIIRVIVQSKKHDHLYNVIKDLVESVKDNKDVTLIGPSTAPIFKLRDNYRYNFLIKAKNKDIILDYCYLIKEKFNKIKKGYMRIKIDVDPYFFI
ncbi:MAG: hypothetical protein SVN78_08910 [Deferribacterota bacterium]|nr:hypothetical protein [Deferribacterota bacterium]